ncbi:Fe-S cluster assembly protein SufB [Thermoactinomyces sp. CICC 24226]|jgi:Fe-S cluster assembly protein SufB|uniref:Fe-S cluster assembly protein SufB n=1 Tax=Thermoactinomyces vulgaris TaxID=2026 RepID=A0ABS0QIM7_THEVU|nr:Fe-S cluster assembly protein SufB [Thermoactinomyces sp. AS95]MBA4552185.1 Fe-S cluster assembly protein SufB [Thermoactinomyces vulgaris]MBH8584258.1 Fe-S cluster assembly protein SufB [Thermoactinomyces sp. CICC 10735]MBH8586594.1 Fe-S cluster assembly protein SufB [Thermoactinomyces sp. CICC 10520]MBI0387571.1 Fe-S cluster assembly protein SufB [Thermoactinomyces sp. CICC 24227]MBI0392346.1 Fe-S cluster assembly protein SufB [Thermoactinomyces sp. CICC 24226]
MNIANLNHKEEKTVTTNNQLPDLSDYKYGFHDKDVSVFRSKKGLSREVVEEISRMKGEPDWMLEFRLKALEQFYKMPLPNAENSQWFSLLPGKLDDLDFDDITYYVKPSERQGRSWDEVPDEIKQTFDKLGIPEAEQKFLAGVSAQYESEVVYHNMQKELEEQGVIFCDTDTAVREYPELLKEYFGTVVPPSDNKFAALNSAVWSGGSFIYVPKGVRCEVPLQAYFRINSQNMGQFERTLIIVDEDAFVHYVEGCTAPIYSTDSLHSAVVEIIVKDNARCRYTTIQNWSPNVYNLVTKRAVAHKGAHMEWVDGNIGSKLTMKYPAVIMKGEGAKADVLSIAVAGKGQHQDAGAKVVALAPNCTSTIVSKSISKQGGKVTYRGLSSFGKNATGSKANVKCDTLILDNESTSDTIPYNEIKNDDVVLEHEATVSKVSEEQLFYLMSRGLTEDEATQMIIMGFIEPFTKELPMEYAVEMNRLIRYEMEGSIG